MSKPNTPAKHCPTAAVHGTGDGLTMDAHVRREDERAAGNP
ncbi:MAG: hypothetical protein RLZ83_789, partial [Pseudomonadota bacterium]